MKRVFMVLYVLVAIVALFASTEVIANGVNPCDPEAPAIPTCCTFVDSSGNPNPSGAGLQVLPGTNNEWPIKQADGRYKWQYSVTNKGDNTFNIMTLAPICYPSITTSNGDGNVLSGTEFLLSPHTAPYKPDTVYFYTDKETPTGRMSLYMTEYNTVTPKDFCRDIAGPVCPGYVPEGLPVNLVPLTTTEYKKLGAYDLRITRDPATWCATQMEICTAYDNNGTCTTWATIPPVTVKINGQDLISCTALDGNQKCQECIVYSASSPGCYTFSSGGRTYKVPTGCH